MRRLNRLSAVGILLASSIAAAADAPLNHPYMLGSAADIPRLRKKFNESRFAAFKQALLAEADMLMTYQGESPQPGKDIGPATRAYKLAAQKKESALTTLPWSYLLTGEERYRDMFLAMMRHAWKRRDDPNQFGWEFHLSRYGAPAALAYDWLWPELSEEDRSSYGAFLDQFMKVKEKPSYGWSNNIGAIYFAGMGLVALARLDENPEARKLLPECIAKLKDPFATASILPHDDSGYPEGPLYRNYALLWMLLFVDAYERTTGDTAHGLLDPPFFRNSPRYIETLLGGDGVWVTFNDCQPQQYGGPWSAYLGARYDLPLLRWFADHVAAELGKSASQGMRREVGPPYSVMAFVWRDNKPATFSGLPQLALLPSLNIGALRSERVVQPGLMLAVRGRGADERGHNQPDTGSFVLYACGENFLLDPGYYQPAAENHSLLVVDGITPQGKKESPLTAFDKGTLRALTVDATADYTGTKSANPRRVRREFVMVDDAAVIVVDDVVAATGAAGNVKALWQPAFAVEVQADKRSAVIIGKKGRLWLGVFGPTATLAVAGPHDFGKSWVFHDLAKEGRLAWHTVSTEYTAGADPFVTVLVPLKPEQSLPKVIATLQNGRLEVSLPGNRMVHFTKADTGWEVDRAP